jgi:HK97 family phage major capsid protein
VTSFPALSPRTAGDIFRSLANGEVRSHVFEKRATLVNSVNTVPVDFLDQVYGIARLVGPMLDVSEVITRTSGNDLRIPTYTAYSTATQVSAGSAISDSEPTFDSILLSPKKQAFIVKIANELLDDAGFDIASVIAEQAGNAIGFRIKRPVNGWYWYHRDRGCCYCRRFWCYRWNHQRDYRRRTH